MKKYLVVLAAVTAVSAAQAADLTVGLEQQIDRADKETYATTLGYSQALPKLGVDLLLNSRITRRDSDNADIAVEAAVGRGMGLFTPYLGVGTDHKLQGTRTGSVQYGIAGLAVSAPVTAQLRVTADLQTRLNWQDDAADQSVIKVGAAYKLAKNLEVVGTVGRSYQDIKDDRVSLGIRTKF